MHLTSLTQKTLISLAAITTIGVLVHDTKIDQAAALALTVPFGLGVAMAAAPSLHSEGHTHAERGSYGKTTVMGMPRIQPRNDHRRYTLTKKLTRTDDFFGGTRVTWPNI